ncbi:MAG: PTS sugar transporter subunit IIA [Hydrogenophilaceae bacterium]|nr:PTS sugar transporter subunit IIA [Hydrogenophilaceae bacterium]
MNLIAPLISSDSTVLNQAFSSKKKLFEHAAQLFESFKGLKRQEVFDSLFERERLGSTALGFGVAIPHGRIKSLKEATGAFYRLTPGLEFDAPDTRPVSLCFILLVPQDANERHLQILGELAQLFGDAATRDRLMKVGTPDELQNLLNSWKP